uniref:G-protein coupled receptor 143 n=1 Tax=Cacopsylla melanoneura TaxID=428564 RepID=A0A8D8SLS7_9HEMI
MADPSIQAFCCHDPDSKISSVKLMSEFNSPRYNTVCLISSVIGICGAVYQLLPRERYPPVHRWYTLTTSRGRKIIIWLAVADLLAAFGVFVRSVLKLYSPLSSSQLLIGYLSLTQCILFNAWIQYFYGVAWIWTLIYSIDMTLSLQDKKSYASWYHACAWGIPAVLSYVGLSLLYSNTSSCDNLSESEALRRILPNYAATYLIIATVMILNPIIYWRSDALVKLNISRQMNQYTYRERMLIDVIRLRFSLIILVFYVCWLPNLINGVILWTMWYDIPKDLELTLWYIMAVVNPLQAFFNSLVYRRKREHISMWPFKRSSSPGEGYETTPLLMTSSSSSEDRSNSPSGLSPRYFGAMTRESHLFGAVDSWNDGKRELFVK